jgi:hypothetical protein
VDLDLISSRLQLVDEALAQQRRHCGTEPVLSVINQDADVEPQGYKSLMKDLHFVACVGNGGVAHLDEAPRELKAKAALLNG